MMTITESERIFPPVMADPMPKVVEAVWRVTEVEIEELSWLVPALQKRWPRLSEESASFWFKAAIGDRRTMFARTKNVVGMAQFDATVKEPWPIVSEVFMRAKEGYDLQEPLWLHKRFAEWAISLRAKAYIFKTDSERVGNVVQIRDMLKKLSGVIGVHPEEIYIATLRD